MQSPDIHPYEGAVKFPRRNKQQEKELQSHKAIKFSPISNIDSMFNSIHAYSITLYPFPPNLSFLPFTIPNLRSKNRNIILLQLKLKLSSLSRRNALHCLNHHILAPINIHRIAIRGIQHRKRTSRSRFHTFKINRKGNWSGSIVNSGFEDVFPGLIDTDDVEGGAEGRAAIIGIRDGEGNGGVVAVVGEELKLVPGTAEDCFGGVGAKGYEIGLWRGRLLVRVVLHVNGSWGSGMTYGPLERIDILESRSV